MCGPLNAKKDVQVLKLARLGFSLTLGLGRLNKGQSSPLFALSSGDAPLSSPDAKLSVDFRYLRVFS